MKKTVTSSEMFTRVLCDRRIQIMEFTLGQPSWPASWRLARHLEYLNSLELTGEGISTIAAFFFLLILLLWLLQFREPNLGISLPCGFLLFPPNPARNSTLNK